MSSPTIGYCQLSKRLDAKRKYGVNGLGEARQSQRGKESLPLAFGTQPTVVSVEELGIQQSESTVGCNRCMQT
jgi:hypothetical protein